MLDTNLWSYIGDEGCAASFNLEIKRRKLQVMMPPSTLVEVVQLSKVDVRQRIIEAIATGPRRRLPTEAHSEGLEIVGEVRRLRPKWMRQISDDGRIASLHTAWTKTLWREALQDSRRMHEYHLKQKRILEHLLDSQRKQKSSILESKFNVRPLTAITASPMDGAPEDYVAGWAGSPVEAWRFLSRDLYWYQLAVVGGRAVVTREDTTVADWIGAYVNLYRLRSDRTDFTRFWLYDVHIENMPRIWLRWAINLVQSESKITSGNPADEQHSTYLLDCDLFLTADKRYVDALRKVRMDSPFTFAEPRLVSGDPLTPILDRIFAAL